MSKGSPVLLVRVSEEMKSRIERAACELGLSVSEVLRMALNNYLAALGLVRDKSQDRENGKQLWGVGDAIGGQKVC